MNQTRFTKLSHVLLLLVLVACQAQTTSVPTIAPLPATAVPPTVAPTTANTQAQTKFSPKIEIPMSISFGSDWTISKDLPRKLGMDNRDNFGISINIVTDAKLADPIDGHLIPFPEDFLSWIKSDLDFQVGDLTDVTVAGIEGVRIDATPIWKSTTFKKLFLQLNGDGWQNQENIVTDPEQWRFILLNNVNGERMLIILINGHGHNFDDAIQQSQKVLDTVVFSKP